MQVFRMKLLTFPLVVIFFALCWQAQRAEAQTVAPKIVGTWKLNLAKSKFTSGAPLRSRTLEWTWDGETLGHTAWSVDADGVSSVARFSAKFDGMTYPVFEGGEKAPVRYVSMEMIDAYNIEVTNKIRQLTFRHSISRDGMTDSITQTSTAEGRQPVVDVLVYDKQ